MCPGDFNFQTELSRNRNRPHVDSANSLRLGSLFRKEEHSERMNSFKHKSTHSYQLFQQRNLSQMIMHVFNDSGDVAVIIPVLFIGKWFKKTLFRKLFDQISGF